MGNLTGQTYVVTGASKGIGRSISLNLAKAGATVALLARESEELKQTTAEAQSHSPGSFSVACDLGEHEAVERAGNTILAKTAQLDGLVHNAGDIHPIQPLFVANLSQWSRSMMVNLVGVQHLTQALHPAMKGAHRVRVTTISSGAALRPIASWSAYCTAKAGLDMWTRCLAEEGATNNISAVSVAPGIVDTDMQTSIRSASPEDFPLLDNFVAYHENGQLTQPDAVASALFDLITAHTLEQSGQRFDVRDL